METSLNGLLSLTFTFLNPHWEQKNSGKLRSKLYNPSHICKYCFKQAAESEAASHHICVYQSFYAIIRPNYKLFPVLCCSQAMPETKRLLCGYHARVAWAKAMVNKINLEENRKLVSLALDKLIRFNDLYHPLGHQRAAYERCGQEGAGEFLRAAACHGEGWGSILGLLQDSLGPKSG